MNDRTILDIRIWKYHTLSGKKRMVEKEAYLSKCTAFVYSVKEAHPATVSYANSEGGLVVCERGPVCVHMCNDC